jgi:lipopolysaccharide/colanic/teichoic acid biosynthesis glycosyltransferase
MRSEPLAHHQRVVKRAFDLLLAVVGIAVTWPVMLVSWVVASLDTRANGLYRQTRVGRHGQPFDVLKIRSMRVIDGTTVTTAHDARITRSGAVLRRFKLDELPQLINVLRGEMSIVGPRPDVPGFADQLIGGDRVVLAVRPGITGPAALAYRHEEELLARAPDPESYNREVIWPDKVRINRDYVENWSLSRDLQSLRETLRSVFASEDAAGSTEGTP